MANLVAVVGASGSGKSTSIETLDPKTTALINVAGKPLPFRGGSKNYVDKVNYFSGSDADKITAAMQYFVDNGYKNIVIDDYQYLMSLKFMELSHQKGFDKFTKIASAGFKPLNFSRNLPSDVNVVFLCHDEESETGIRQIKTSGKMLSNHVTVEGLFSVVLFTHKYIEEGNVKCKFITQSDGTTTAKSPKGMFKDLLIDNDLKYVLEEMNNYY